MSSVDVGHGLESIMAVERREGAAKPDNQQTKQHKTTPRTIGHGRFGAVISRFVLGDPLVQLQSLDTMNGWWLQGWGVGGGGGGGLGLWGGVLQATGGGGAFLCHVGVTSKLNSSQTGGGNPR